MRIVINKKDFMPVVKSQNKYSIFFDVLPMPSSVESEENINCEVQDAPLTLTEDGIKTIIINSIKARYSKEIMNGFAYDEEHFITLSEYDQTNFSRLYSLKDTESLYPLTINIGRSEDQHTILFDNKEDFEAIVQMVWENLK